MYNAELNYETVPNCYKHCNISECPLADNCLRFKAYQILPETIEEVIMINPKASPESSGKCKYHRPVETIIMSRGFNHIKSLLTADQYKRFKDIAISTFGKTGYYRDMHGKTPIPPKEQKQYMSILLKISAKFKPDEVFESFETLPDW